MGKATTGDWKNPRIVWGRGDGGGEEGVVVDVAASILAASIAAW
jgi:hypothetical protein